MKTYKIVKFKGYFIHKYAVKFEDEFIDLKSDGYTWSIDDCAFKDCLGTYRKVKKVFNMLTDINKCYEIIEEKDVYDNENQEKAQIIIDDVNEADKKKQNDLFNYLKSHDWSYMVDYYD